LLIADCGVPCTSETSAAGNIEALLKFTGLTREQIEKIGHNALLLFPSVASRIGQADRKIA
jgi:hypothetical protein